MLEGHGFTEAQAPIRAASCWSAFVEVTETGASGFARDVRGPSPYFHSMSARRSRSQPPRADRSAASPSDSRRSRPGMAPSCVRRGRRSSRCARYRPCRDCPAAGRASFARARDRRVGRVLIDQLLRLLWTSPPSGSIPINPSAAERMVLIAVGGYGRGEMAPHSDIDIGSSPHVEGHRLVRAGDRDRCSIAVGHAAEVGHSSRSLGEMVRSPKPM